MILQYNKTTNGVKETSCALLDIYQVLGVLRLTELEGKYEINVDIKKIE